MGNDLRTENVIQLDVLRVERSKPRKCVCEQPSYIVDSKNREITCGCGVVHDAFEALLDIANYHEEINRKHEALYKQKQEWLKQKPWSVLFKQLEQHYKRGTMLPYCPKCNDLFDFKEITSWGNAEFYRRLEARQLQIDD